MQLCYICYIMLHQNVTRQSLNWIGLNTVHEEMLHKLEDILQMKTSRSESSGRFWLKGLPHEKV